MLVGPVKVVMRTSRIPSPALMKLQLMGIAAVAGALRDLGGGYTYCAAAPRVSAQPGRAPGGGADGGNGGDGGDGTSGGGGGVGGGVDGAGGLGGALGGDGAIGGEGGNIGGDGSCANA